MDLHFDRLTRLLLFRVDAGDVLPIQEWHASGLLRGGHGADVPDFRRELFLGTSRAAAGHEEAAYLTLVVLTWGVEEAFLL